MASTQGLRLCRESKTTITIWEAGHEQCSIIHTKCLSSRPINRSKWTLSIKWTAKSSTVVLTIEIMNASFDRDVIQADFLSQSATEGLDLALQHLYEINVVECTGNRTSFVGKDLFITIATNVSFTRAQIQVFVRLVRTYKHLNANYCDPFARRLQRLAFEYSVELGKSSDGCKQYILQLSVGGTCRGCLNGNAILDDSQAITSRRLVEEDDAFLLAKQLVGDSPESEPPAQRRQQGTSNCYREQETVANRVPTGAEFQAALQAAVAASRGPISSVFRALRRSYRNSL